MESTVNVLQIKIMFALCVYAGRGIAQIVNGQLTAWKIVDFFFKSQIKEELRLFVCEFADMEGSVKNSATYEMKSLSIWASRLPNIVTGNKQVRRNKETKIARAAGDTKNNAGRN